jgi:hypothetical protein
VAEVCGVRVEEALALDEIDEHQAIEHDGRIPFAVGRLTDAVNELEEGFAVGVKVAVERFGDALNVKRGAGALGDGEGGQLALLFFFERDEEGLQFLEEGVAGLGAIELVGAGRQGAAGFAADPDLGLPPEVGGGEYDEMFKAGLRQGAVEFQARGVIRQVAVSPGAQPSGEATLLGDGREGIIGFSGTKGQLLAAWLPAEFLDEQLGEVSAMEERAGALEVEGHWGERMKDEL